MSTYELTVSVKYDAVSIYNNPPELTGTFMSCRDILIKIIEDVYNGCSTAIMASTVSGSAFTIELELKIDGSVIYNPKVVHTITGASIAGIKEYLIFGMKLMIEKAKTYV